MTAMPEAKLAREAELPYATAAFVTDFDCWNDSEAAVSADQVLTTLHANAALAPRIVAALAEQLPDPAASPAFGALSNSILTEPSHSDPHARETLGWLLGPPQL
jgi:5'-methylthioadenosine phosphorylase